MRLYDYRCGCGETATSSHPDPPLCICGNMMIRDWTTAIIFNGAGFYVNDHRP